MTTMFPPIRNHKETKGKVPTNTMQFGSIMVELYQLGQQTYRIVWRSKMTGASTTFICMAKDKYQVIRQWAQNKKLPDINIEFQQCKLAFSHFLRNVDIVKIAHDILRKAREFCTGLFAEQENLPDIKAPDFRFGRLQSAIGKKVNIYSKTSKDHLIARGYLLQLVGNEVEVHITERLDLQNPKKIQKFATNRAFLL
ncbi:hypothetical protein SG34_017560 [Thalassomonas viridans]|uniref:Uncharacterized protein n=1 Tax=Thalassomonas viridans TaxID=137584 RepID=A0AAE9YZD4_9GAMM|nr:hypothetical protein [Thalassomonas viridans]WDE03204.1 hypothetical protein SG34_017560 [Thalassomonas viridans]